MRAMLMKKTSRKTINTRTVNIQLELVAVHVSGTWTNTENNFKTYDVNYINACTNRGLDECETKIDVY